MRAAVFTAVDEPLSVEEVEPLPPGPHDLVVDIGASGVCHTEAAIMTGALPWTSPSILGHEATGRVLEVGAAVEGIAPGDQVIGTGMPACMACFFCVRGQTHLCEAAFRQPRTPRARRANGDEVTAFGSLGTFAETMTVHEASVVKVESDLPAEQLALIGCAVTTGVGAAVATARIEPGTTVTVVGCGGVGQCVVQGARVAGAAQIIAVDPVPLKREAALRLGATHAVDPADGDPVAQVRDLTDGRGTDYGFEVVGRPETITDAYQATRRGGVMVVVGMPSVSSTVSFPGLELFLDAKEIRVSNLGSMQIRRDIPRLVHLADAGRLDLASMITRRIDLGEVNDAIEAMDRGDVIRSVIV